MVLSPFKKLISVGTMPPFSFCKDIALSAATVLTAAENAMDKLRSSGRSAVMGPSTSTAVVPTNTVTRFNDPITVSSLSHDKKRATAKKNTLMRDDMCNKMMRIQKSLESSSFRLTT
jgi:hypothetical protein